MGFTSNISRTKRLVAAFTILVTLLVGAATYAFFHAGSWLIREDALERSQAIVVLSGALPERALGAADLYRAGYAKEVWLTHPLEPGAAMEGLHLPYAGEEQYSRMVLIEKGVSPADIRVLKPRILNTADELRAVFEAMDVENSATIIVVTSKAHTRRVRELWRKIANRQNQGRLLVRAAREDYFDAEHWWRTSNDALLVIHEYLGLLNAWAGSPLDHTR
jgi:uncharacterized SAM-binding protein YcdF (DUF218 family)